MFSDHPYYASSRTSVTKWHFCFDGDKHVDPNMERQKQQQQQHQGGLLVEVLPMLRSYVGPAKKQAIIIPSHTYYMSSLLLFWCF